MTTILVIEDEWLIRDNITDALEDAGHTVITAENADDAIHDLSHHAIDCVVSDGNFPGGGLQKVIEHVKVPMLVLSGSQEIKQWVNDNFKDIPFMGKPYSSVELVGQVNKLYERAARPKELIQDVYGPFKALAL